jgi:hypothetical protein
VACQHGGGASDGSRDLEDLRVEENGRVTAWGGGLEHQRVHGARGCVQHHHLLHDRQRPCLSSHSPHPRRCVQ